MKNGFNTKEIERKRNELLKSIRKHRKSSGYTQVKMAEKLCVSISCYRKIEQGTSRLDMDRLIKISKVLGFDFYKY